MGAAAKLDRLMASQENTTDFVRGVFTLVRGLYTAASGALAAQTMADTVANNLANVTSSGFKETLLQIQSAPSLNIYRIQTDPGRVPDKALAGVPVAQYVGALGTGAQIYDTPVDYKQGTLEQTGNSLDLALVGANGFFSVQTPQGVRYTRDGQFSLDNNGNLVTQDGNLVTGTNGGPITIPAGPFSVATDGTISQNGAQVGQINLTQFTNLVALRKQGDNLFVNTGAAQPQPAAGVSMQQGFLEKSSGNVIRSMVDLIVAERWFDANSKSIKAEDSATGTAIAKLGRSVPQ